MRLSSDDRRAQLVALGLDLFSRLPYEQVGIEDLAQQGGISKGLLYHYFGGKKSFYLACLRLATEDLVASVLAEPGDGPERLRAGLLAYLRWARARAAAYLGLMGGAMGGDPEVLGLLELTRQQILDDLLRRAGLVQVRPAFRQATRAWLGGVEAAAQDWLRHEDLPAEALVDLLSAQLGVALQWAAVQDPVGAAQLMRPPGALLASADGRPPDPAGGGRG